MSRKDYGGLGEDPYASNRNGSFNGYGNMYANEDGYAPNGYLTQTPTMDDYDPYGDRYGTPEVAPTPSPPPQRSAHPRRNPRVTESLAEREIEVVLDRIKANWPAMCQDQCVPVQVALQLLDTSSVGRAHEYKQFKQAHTYLQDSLKAIVHEHHQGFNSSIGTFHKIQSSIQVSQKRVRTLKDSLAQSKTSLSTTDSELKKLATASRTYDEFLRTLSDIQELRVIPDQLEARISEKQFLSAVEVLQNGLRRIRAPELDGIGALTELRSYLNNQEAALTDILVEELHDHLYLKSPYCQERWQTLVKLHGEAGKESTEKPPSIQPFFERIDSLEVSEPMVEDPTRNPELDTFYYIELLIESLNKLGNLESAVDTIKQRLPVELFGIVNETNSEVDQKHPISLRGGMSTFSHQTFTSRENSIRADVIDDLLCNLYAKFEAIAEGHRVLHDVIKAIMRRAGSRYSATMLGGFKELWHLYQNEIRSLLHNYVTTSADQLQSKSFAKSGVSKLDSRRDHLFQFSDTDSKSVQMTTEFQDLEGIIRAAVPGLMSGNPKAGAEGKKNNAMAHRSLIESSIQRSGSRRDLSLSIYDSKNTGTVAYRPLVEPSVFNMSLLLPPTVGFLQRLKNIVPPGSDLVTSTLTSFLDNFLVNVFLPQLDETLSKLSESVFEESDAFQQDTQWTHVSQLPIFKGTSAFYTLVMAFCKMLDTIPHDQALSALIITQMIKYYDKCCDWFTSLVSRIQDSGDGVTLRLGAYLATEPSDIQQTMKNLWMSEGPDRQILDKETSLLILQTNKTTLRREDIIPDRETISSLCVLYTSMKWLAIKIEHLRHITHNEVDSTRMTMQKPVNRSWTLTSHPGRGQDEEQFVYLPMTQETVASFDSIVSSFQELASTVLLTIHMEVRCQIIHSLSLALSPSHTSYVLEQVVNHPDPSILSLNADLVNYDETITQFLRKKETSFIRTGLGLLVDTYLTTNAGKMKAMNAHGCGRMQLNILVLQQNLKNIEEDVNLEHAARYFDLFMEGPDAIVREAKKGKGFGYEELKTLVELCFSEQLGSPERGISSGAKRRMDEVVLSINECV